MDILQRTGLRRRRFAGVREHRLVMDPRLFGDEIDPLSWTGRGNLVYLADARFVGGGETGMHDHHDIDVITLVVEGRLEHRGSLQDGGRLEAGDVQVQRAGGEGFAHNEINPDPTETRLIQIWVLPEEPAGPAAYYGVSPETGRVTRVYGGKDPAAPVAGSGTLIDVATLKSEQSVDIDVPCLVYVCRGKGYANEDLVSEGDLLRAEQLTFDAVADTQIIVVHEAG